MPTRGIVFSATGARHIAAGLAAAERSLAFNHIPPLLFCSSPPALGACMGQTVHYASDNTHLG